LLLYLAPLRRGSRDDNLGRADELARKPAQKNAGRAGMLNPLGRNGPHCIGSQPVHAKGEVGRVGPLARLQNYMLSFF